MEKVILSFCIVALFFIAVGIGSALIGYKKEDPEIITSYSMLAVTSSGAGLFFSGIAIFFLWITI